jgi:hypothetical protein
MKDGASYLFFGVVLIVIVLALYFQATGAIQCAEDGGAYLRSWTGWPTCVMEGS